MESWRLLDTGVLSAAENMALDDVILDCRSRNISPNTIRFLQFSPPAVLVGFHQTVEHEVRTEFCKANGIDINRRLTGGGAILFDEKSLGWEVIASKASLEADQPLFYKEEFFERMCEGVLHGLQVLGIQAHFRPKNDIEVDGRKISGTGGTERDKAFLFQGTLLVDFDAETMIKALRIPVLKLKDKEIKSVRERVTCINRELEYTPDMIAIKSALAEGFEKTFKTRLVNGRLSNHEKEELNERLRAFKSEDWVLQDRQPKGDTAEVYAVSKTQGGLIRASLTLDKPSRLIKSALITGDFFVFPSRAILDLEAMLKGTACDEKEIGRIVKDFYVSHVSWIPGVSPEDLVNLILEAVEKTEYESFGISLEEANHIHAVGGGVKDLLDEDYGALLLPYCAKLPTCEYRKTEGCVRCGKCSTGSVYDLAEGTGLTSVTIQNFEHLIATLETLRESGVRAYIGCCCEGFYCKHHDDLEAIKMPGILVDIDDETCYDLGKEKEALEGNFERQTELKVALLSKLMKRLLKPGEASCLASMS